jgi:Tfp pilus assembly protein PilV
MVSATVVLIALVLVGVGVSALLHRQLLAAVDDAAARRVRDVVDSLQSDSASDLDDALLATDQRIAVVQIVDAAGTVVRASRSAPPKPIVPLDNFGPAQRGG